MLHPALGYGKKNYLNMTSAHGGLEQNISSLLPSSDVLICTLCSSLIPGVMQCNELTAPLCTNN